MSLEDTPIFPETFEYDFSSLGTRFGASITMSEHELHSLGKERSEGYIRSRLAENISHEIMRSLEVEKRDHHYPNTVEFSTRFLLVKEKDYYKMLRVVEKLIGNPRVVLMEDI